MKILFLTQTTDRGPSSRVRGYQMAEALRQLGDEVTVLPGISEQSYHLVYGTSFIPFKVGGYFVAWIKRLLQIKKMKQFDIVVIQKEIFPHFYPLVEKILYRLNIPYVFDFDDALFTRGGRPNWLPKILKRAAGVTVGNAFLEEYAHPYQKNILHLPSCVSLPEQIASFSDETTCLGWIGSRSSWKHFMMIWPVLKNLLRYKHNISVAIMGDRLPQALKNDAQGRQIEFIPWTLDQEERFLQGVDIGLAPLSESAWSEGKCAYKTLQYMSYGLPVVASPIGVQKELVQNYSNGFLAQSINDWEEKLNQLIGNKKSWKKLGLSGRKKIEENYSFDVQAPRLKQFLEECVSKK